MCNFYFISYIAVRYKDNIVLTDQLSTTSFKQSNETPNPVKEVTFTDKTTGFEVLLKASLLGKCN